MMKCKKCQSESLVMRPNAKTPSATEVVCGDCGAWQKFIGKDEIRLFELRSLQKKLTNADRIRSMSDEELARWLVDATVCERVCGEDVFCHGDECVNRVTDWLKQPVKEEHNEAD